ncbi:Protein of unknown function [Burkholderia sp. OK233]|nr:Protein of unknown function [Burkholderia sp. OK233]
MNEVTLTFQVDTKSGSAQRDIAVREAVIAGWTGRDVVALEKHIVELEALGVARPASTPIFYRVAAARLSQVGYIEVSGSESSGEVEFVLLSAGGRRYVGVGSDHTDRKVETYGVTVSKQMCEKPIAPVLWEWDEVAVHWDELVLRSYVMDKDEWSLYQEGPVSAMRAPADLVARYARSETLPEGTAMFCGTLAARGGIRPSSRFWFELEDPVLGRTIRHRYDVVELPVHD